MRTSTSARRLLGIAAVTALVSALSASAALSAHADEDEARSFADCPLLVEGDEGECVERLQRDLNLLPTGYDLPETGYFGARTRIAVLDFQGRNDLDADGNVGGETADALIDQLSVQSPRTGGVQAGSEAPPGRESTGHRCTERSDPTTDDYLSGRQCPPAGFPYAPEIVDTRNGQRALDPFDDGCSGPLVTEDQLYFDFNQACETHDYAYDLVRWGGTLLDEHAADAYFERDLRAACANRSALFKPACHASASGYAYFVQAGTPRAKDGIVVDGRRVDVEATSPFRNG